MKKTELSSKKVIVCTENELGDYVSCCNCGVVLLLNMGDETCPQCGVDGCLEWVDNKRPEMTVEEVSKETETIMKRELHVFEPTDTEGHSMQCIKCGRAISFYEPEDWANGLVEKCV